MRHVAPLSEEHLNLLQLVGFYFIENMCRYLCERKEHVISNSSTQQHLVQRRAASVYFLFKVLVQEGFESDQQCHVPPQMAFRYLAGDLDRCFGYVRL